MFPAGDVACAGDPAAVKPLRIFGFISVLFAVLVMHLFRMQAIDYKTYRTQSERNRIRPVILEAPRGLMLDRHGREVVSNRLAFDCYLIPQEGKRHLERTLGRLKRILGESESRLTGRYLARKKGAFTPVLLAGDIEKESAIRIEEYSDRMPGIFIKTRPVREYPLGKAAAHVFGYIGPLDAEEYRQLREGGYRMADWIGRSGIEKSFESYLRGQSGAVQYEVDSHGRLLRVLNIQEPHEGKTLELTLDLDLQETASALLEEQTGAVVVMDLSDGGVLAMASSPSFDPNLFLRPSRERSPARRVLVDPKKPLINRAISAEYPPGSTFKIVTAVAALSGGKITERTSFFCPGFFTLGGRTFKCWQRSGHGTQNLIEAIEHSCNVFFYNVATRLDIDALGATAAAFGLGEKTTIDLAAEKKGLVPSRDWKRKTTGEEWYRGETVITAIGQGYLLVTPLQILRAASVAASDGVLFRPHLVKKIAGVDVAPRPPARGDFVPSHLAAVREGMKRVVGSPTGTGQRARSAGIEAAGKTGTAQSSTGDAHAWFVGYAPAASPEMGVVVFLEHGGRGGISAAAIAGEVFRWMTEKGYFA